MENSVNKVYNAVKIVPVRERMNDMKRRISLVLTVALIIASFMPVYATNISIDGKNVQFTEASGSPFVDQANRTQVPFRQTMETFGCVVSWDPETRSAIAEKDGITVKVPIGAQYIIKNGVTIQNDTAALIRDNKTYLPIRAVLEAFGATVSWDKVSQTVVVVSGSSGSEPEIIMTIHFIDVGQADSIFIDFEDYEVLIDAGNNGDGDRVVNYIRPYVSGNLDLVIATHAHEDHIGGLDDVLAAYQVSQLIDSGDTATSVTYKDYYAAASAEPNCPYIADKDMEIDMGNGATIRIIDTMDGNSNTNNNSVISLLDYNSFEILFPGDAEAAAEATFLGKLYDIDVLKAGHHGSKTASSQGLLNLIRPETVIISAGLVNQYDHPHEEALQRFAGIGASVYGTFKSGSIVLTTNGNTYSLNTSTKVTVQDAVDKGSTAPQQTVTNPAGVSKSEAAYIGNSSTKKFHRLNCRYADQISLANIIYFKQRADAVNTGYDACKVCNP
jgi:competence protein ComEC